MNRVLIFGDSGLLGQQLVVVGRKIGFEVRGASRNSSDIKIDIEQLNTIDEIINKIKPTIVINAAGLISIEGCEENPQKAWLRNTRFPCYISRLCNELDIKFVQISTDHYFSGAGYAKNSEDAHIRLSNEYALSKYSAEILVKQNPQSLIVRTNIIGFRSKPGEPTFIEWLIQQLESKNKVTLYNDYVTSSLTAKQCAYFVYRSIQKEISGLINIASRDAVSKYEFGIRFAQRFKFESELIAFGSVFDKSKVVRCESLGLAVENAECLLNEKMPDLCEVIDDLFLDYKLQL